MDGKVKILLVGAGGYGHMYVNAILDELYKSEDYPIEAVGVIDPVHTSPSYIRMVEAGVPEYDDMEQFYKDNTADLCIISTPISLHKEQVICALRHGSNVLCEKPAAGCVQDIKDMIEARKQAGKFVSVGFQLSYSQPVLDLKKDIINGVWGKPVLIKSITMFPRSYKYFGRSGWVGKKYSRNGVAIMDSIANNAAAHALHNVFFILGKELNRADMPVSCDCHLYRANDIETYDGVSAVFKTESGADILYYAAHPVEHTFGPAFEFIFENGKITLGIDNKNVVGVFSDGTVKDYGNVGGHLAKLFSAVDTVLGRGDKIYCGLETVLPHATAVEMLDREMEKGNVMRFGGSDVKTVKMKDEDGIIIKGLEEKFLQGFKDGVFVK